MTIRRLVPIVAPAGQAALGLLPVLRAALSGEGPAVLPHAAGTEPARSLAPGAALASDEDDPDDPTVVVVATSGSTGHPKGALLSAGALLASASATHDRLGGPGQWLLALPAEHVAGLQVLIRSLVARTEPVILDLSGGFDPAAFAAAAGRARASRRYTSLVPTQLLRLLDAGGAALAALTRFDAVLVGGAATPVPLLARAREAGVAVVTTYGMSETCGGCVYDGVPLDGVTARTQGPQGRIVLGGPMVARGYRGGDGGRAFGRDPDGTRWFRTDDSGVSLADGTLSVTGRLDDILVTGGLKVDPGQVEAALLAMPGVAEVVVVGASDRQWGQRVVAAVVAAPGTTAPTLEQVRARVSARLAPHAAPRQLLVLEAIPLRGPGKPDRVELARLAVLGDRD